MKIIDGNDIILKVRDAFISANFNLPACVSEAMEGFAEKSGGAEQKVLRRLIENAKLAKEINVPVCQDTGMAVAFVKIGSGISIKGMSLSEAINEGVRRAYTEGGLRLSVVSDPLRRQNSNDNAPAVIHYEFIPHGGECDSDTLEIDCMPKGFGSENMSRVKMMNPTSDKKDIIEFIVETVSIAGSNPCPPVILGIGIGGDFEYAALLSKKALLRDINIPHEDPLYAELESDILCEVNKLNIGTQGFGGVCSCLGVNIEKYPTHIASLPVAVNVCCHVMRHEKIVF